MIATFESILPVFLLIGAGNLIRRLPLVDRSAWTGLEQLGFWFLYPVLLFTTIERADFSRLALDSLLGALMSAVGIAAVATLALWPAIKRTGWIAHSQFSTVYQCTVRWNGFMALAIAEKLFAPEATAVVALAMAVIVIPVNLFSVYVVTRFADATANWATVAKRISTNPLVLAATAGVLARYLPGGIYSPLGVTLDLLARAALGMGLLAIGAGLRPGDMASLRVAVWLPVALKLAAFPLLLIAIALGFGITGDGIVYLALCGAVPTAMNGYLLAKQMGGDASLYAAVATVQTTVSFVSIPVVLALAQAVSG